MTFDPKSVEVTCVTLPKDHCVQVSWKYIKVCGCIDPFFKNINQRSLTPRWPLTSYLLRSHVWLYPRTIVSKSHGNTSMYVDTVINFTKYHIHTTYRQYILYTYRMSDPIVFLNTFRQDKKQNVVLPSANDPSLEKDPIFCQIGCFLRKSDGKCTQIVYFWVL